MGAHVILAELALRHQFFAGGRCKGLALQLDDRSSALAARAGLLTRHGPNGVVVLYDRDRLDTLRLYASDHDEPFALTFRAIAVDPLFSDYTDPPTRRDGAILFFDSRIVADPAVDGPRRLSADELVSAADFVDLEAEPVRDLLSERDRHLRPVALVRIHLADAAGELLGDGQAGPPPSYTLEFGTRATFWRYLLLGSLAARNTTVVDPDHATDFGRLGETQLPGGRTAVAFRSLQPIQLRERSDRRFQLRDNGTNGSGNGRLLVRRLPVATPRGMRRETIEGEVAFVSDIYLNG